MPRRRLSLVVAAGVLAVVALTGCQVEPGSAAFVENRTYSKADVDHLLNQFRADGGQLDPADEGPARGEIARDQVFVDLASRYARDKGYSDPNIDAASVAQGLRVPDSDPLAQLLAKQSAYKDLLLGKATAVQPTDAELHEMYDLLVAQQVKLSYDEAVGQLRQVSGLGEALAVRRGLADAVQRYHVRLNPLYDAGFSLLSVQDQTGQNINLVVLSLSGDGQSPVVRDVIHG